MVTDTELVDRLREFLSTSDLNTTTTAIVRRKLEEDFGIDLSDRKAFIREQVDLYLQSQFENEPNEEQEDNDDGAEETEEAADDDGGDDEDEEPEHSSNGKAAAKKRSKKKTTEVKKKQGGGFTKLCSLSPELQKFTGVPELARTEVVKQLWCYIREHNLQDPSNRRNIKCDDTLLDLFGVDIIDMFQMNKALAKHIWPLGSSSAPVNSSPPAKKNSSPPPKKKRQKQEKEEESDEARQEKRQKSGSSGILAPIPLSDALVTFLGTGETALSRSDVVKRIWGYIKQNNLQDPSDKRRILCDEKLKELFNVDTFNGFSVAKYLTAHFIKKEQ